MARVRVVEINNFRGIKTFTWRPSPGVNCLVGSGDSGKSSILDAIDYCLGARRNLQFTDSDFHGLSIETPITVSVTIGELDEEVKNVDSYGLYLRGFDAESGAIVDEPEAGAETVLTVRLTVTADLEPSWSLMSDRAEAQGLTRSLSWNDRMQIAPARLGLTAGYHLSWRRGAVLTRVSDDQMTVSGALARAARNARLSFGDEARDQLTETLRNVKTAAEELGVRIQGDPRALLDADAVSFGDGAVSLHDDVGVPLRRLGTGSTRLLITGLQRVASATRSSVILIDEVEYGLEPHRIIRLLGSLGAKEKHPPSQVFMTTHSPVVVRELSAGQLFVLRPGPDRHEAMRCQPNDDMQSTIRLYPDAFLAASVIVCEGATEVGLVRGLDLYRVENGLTSMNAQGVALVDGGGGDSDRLLQRACVFQGLGYRTAVVRDDDKQPDEMTEREFVSRGGEVISWRSGHALEDELFLSLSPEGVGKALDRAIELHGAHLIDQHIKSVSQNLKDLNGILVELRTGSLDRESRQILGRAARSRKAGWYKSISWMENLARDVIGPDLAQADEAFRDLVDSIFAWSSESHG